MNIFVNVNIAPISNILFFFVNQHNIQDSFFVPLDITPTLLVRSLFYINSLSILDNICWVDLKLQYFVYYSLFIEVKCIPPSNAANCGDQKNRNDCLSTKESRTLELYGQQLKDSICVWCDGTACTPDNDNQCEPKTFLDGYETANPGTTNNYEHCLAGNAHL